MTIKQQGGIFGRNPTFNDVEAKDITSETLVVNSNSSDAGFFEATGGYALAAFQDASSANHTSLELRSDGGSASNSRYLIRGYGNYSSSPTETYYVTSGGYQYLANNLIFASGSGIDFSATSGTGTSELFDDYEEGTWTAQLADSNTGTINYSSTTATGHYTKIGNIVHVSVSGWNNIDTTGMTSTNSLYMTLPFSGVTPHSVGSAVLNTFDFNTGSQVVIQSYYANALFYTNTDNATQSTLRVNDITSGVSDIAALSLTYRV